MEGVKDETRRLAVGEWPLVATGISIGMEKDAMKTLRPSAPGPLILAALLTLGACATTAPPPLRTVTDVDADAGPVQLARGQDLEIALPLNAGTGYAWRLDREAPAILSGGSSFMTDAKMPGAPVRTVYRYTAVRRGKTDLAFTLKRPWEPDRPGDRKVVFHIKVR